MLLGTCKVKDLAVAREDELVVGVHKLDVLTCAETQTSIASHTESTVLLTDVGEFLSTTAQLLQG